MVSCIGGGNRSPGKNHWPVTSDWQTISNKGNAKHGISPRLKIWPGDLHFWPVTLKINKVFQILECSQGCYMVNIWPGDLWPWKSIEFQILLRTKYVSSLVKIHWRMLILKCSQGCYLVKIWPGNLDLWPWKSIGFQTFLRTKYVPSLVKIHWRMLILECSQGCYGRKDGSVTISFRNFVGEGIIMLYRVHLAWAGFKFTT
jgi:hypothetical protein